MGPPLAGSDVRAYVMTGGGLRLKGLIPRYRSRRVQMIFPLRGTEKRGLVSLEAKRRKVPRATQFGEWLVSCASGVQRIHIGVSMCLPREGFCLVGSCLR